MNLKEALTNLPDTNKVVVSLSGGLDSTTAMRLCVEKYGAKNVSAISFRYGQKQALELDKAVESTTLLGVEHKIIDAAFYGEINQGFSANVDADIAMPTIQDVLGDPTPKTYLANRNMIFFAITAAFAETRGADTIICGLQATDEYNYWDNGPTFTNAMNAVFNLNRKIKIKLVSPFVSLTKEQEIYILKELDSNIDLLKHTLTCYNPNYQGESCGKCPTCAERINAFMKVGVPDPVAYSVTIPWRVV